jgi:hypothetical protein
MSNWLSAVRESLKKVYEENIVGLHVYTYEPDGVLEYPALVLGAPSVPLIYDAPGGTEAAVDTIIATLYVVSGNSEAGWEEIDAYRSPFGDKSLKAVLRDSLDAMKLKGEVDDSYVSRCYQATRNRGDNFWEFSVKFDICYIKTER